MRKESNTNFTKSYFNVDKGLLESFKKTDLVKKETSVSLAIVSLIREEIAKAKNLVPNHVLKSVLQPQRKIKKGIKIFRLCLESSVKKRN